VLETFTNMDSWVQLAGVLALCVITSIRLYQDSPHDDEKLKSREQALIELENRIRTLEEILETLEIS